MKSEIEAVDGTPGMRLVNPNRQPHDVPAETLTCGECPCWDEPRAALVEHRRCGIDGALTRRDLACRFYQDILSGKKTVETLAKGLNLCPTCNGVFPAATFAYHVEFCCAATVSVLPLSDLQTKTESYFQGKLMVYLKENGFLAYHPYRSDKSEKGYPDTSMIRLSTGERYWAELKMRGKKPTAEQIEWLDAYAYADRYSVFLWFPEDREAIEAFVRNEPMENWRWTLWEERRDRYVYDD